MAKPAETYAQTAQKTGSPRELEAQLLMRAAAKLQAAKNATDRIERLSALHYNRRLWLVFADSVTKADNPLPREIKQNVANLAIFVAKHTMSIETATELQPERLGVLININREIAAGLRTRPAA
jgi:flagellar biosynthesis activator protein FlaF